MEEFTASTIYEVWDELTALGRHLYVLPAELSGGVILNINSQDPIKKEFKPITVIDPEIVRELKNYIIKTLSKFVKVHKDLFDEGNVNSLEIRFQVKDNEDYIKNGYVTYNMRSKDSLDIFRDDLMDLVIDD